MQIIILIVGIGLGIYGHSWVTEKFPDTRPDYCTTKTESTESIGTKIDKVIEVIKQ
ncbi:hypothetical protein FOI42_RS02705 [Escherichia coli]|nr:hypothetical protein [Escherichia coli]MED6699213.1 hypothetical protein [Escherichia coli O157]USL83852.1 hypothetical protein A4_185 [Escherichia phage A4]HCQ0858770.1 hypothetical protein [Escherichia coli]